ncbi:MAG: neutral/alkaline non-lysosomal ceramidase N-terminal domain-containing protein [Candidatus Hydrogenedentes bacterium]|nr:neutral/alkaline non-lysosomal ceramidase N-terminal domain-containing protein [Candidatus Hydrogenedentota bacterium]
MKIEFVAGAAVADITPRDSQFLYGYPHRERYSTGIHDPLLTSSLYLREGSCEALILANDIIYVSKALCRRVRRKIAEISGVPESHILISATHTHSGPTTVDILSNASDPTIPKADPAYLAYLETRMVASALNAQRKAVPAQLGLAVAHTDHTRTNRHDPADPADPEVPVLVVRSIDDGRYVACMLVHCLHPTVLHEDSTLITADFPGMVRGYLQERVLGPDCPVLHHIGPAGNQSPRHVVADNTFASARALGEDIGRSIEAVLPTIKYRKRADIAFCHANLDLIPRRLPSVEAAAAGLEAARARFQRLKAESAAAKEVRTAECDWFGAEETLALAVAAAANRLGSVYDECQPAEIQVIGIGPWTFVAWPGEIFVEYGLEVRRRHPNTFVISLANGELQGYIATEQAVLEGYYEAGNALFDYRNGVLLVNRTDELLGELRAQREATQAPYSPVR